MEELSGTIVVSDQMRQLMNEGHQKTVDRQCSDRRNRSHLIVHFVTTIKTCLRCRCPLHGSRVTAGSPDKWQGFILELLQPRCHGREDKKFSMDVKLIPPPITYCPR